MCHRCRSFNQRVGRLRMSTGPLTYLYKKYVTKVETHSSDAAKVLERIREQYGPNAGYQSALAVVQYIENVDKTGQYIDPSRYAAYLRDCPMAVPLLRRALDYLIADQSEIPHDQLFRD
ncbi:hypothetical protein ANRL2_04642 [Anaerolineae bacterium]|nr:hypothetical protein ANRL2_04642 [Anaerolineae bacterium]